MLDAQINITLFCLPTHFYGSVLPKLFFRLLSSHAVRLVVPGHRLGPDGAAPSLPLGAGARVPRGPERGRLPARRLRAHYAGKVPGKEGRTDGLSSRG